MLISTTMEYITIKQKISLNELNSHVEDIPAK